MQTNRLFLSTPSARRATASSFVKFSRCRISIHALREEGDLVYGRQRRGKLISIHALREEGDAAGREERRLRADFYPRPP